MRGGDHIIRGDEGEGVIRVCPHTLRGGYNTACACIDMGRGVQYVGCVDVVCCTCVARGRARPVASSSCAPPASDPTLNTYRGARHKHDE